MLKKIDYSIIPAHCRESVKAYVEEGRPVAGFLQTVLEDKLVESFLHADPVNLIHMRDWANFLQNEAPFRCWGSKDLVHIWMKTGGLKGLKET